VNETIKLAKDLVKGDVVLFADLVDVVDRVEDEGGAIVTVYVSNRSNWNGTQSWFCAGKESKQRVKV
jgi:hypothetical protein